jgi:mono/diheme cytochrome c family protein
VISGRTGLIIGAVVTALGLGLAGWHIQTVSEVLLTARHPLPLSAVKADASPEALARGARLVVVTGCISCHGPDLSGKTLTVSGSQVQAPGLGLAAHKRSDAELDLAIRYGLSVDGRSEVAMPAYAYARLTDQDLSAIIGYLRSLPARGAPAAVTKPSLGLRADLALGRFHLASDRLASARAPLDAGPQTAAGRYLASVSCAQCHGSDLGGGAGNPGPDLTIRGYFNRQQFYALLKRGEAIGEGDVETMARASRQSFSHYSDDEIGSIYAYLDARDRLLSSQGPAPAKP